ncbi:MAG: AraC family transcriptional regulator [Deltaproteobacteria bacterium]|jgi:AraC-like DNA-binding protein|nr:AraC family transcriptional regulator [Deltaproteobacteria bacterium]
MTDKRSRSLDRTNSLLADKILHWLPEPGQLQTAIDGFSLSRIDEIPHVGRCFYQPVIGVVIQGAKRSVLGTKKFEYEKNQCLLVGVDLPGVFRITKASPEEPFLGITLSLDRYLVASLAAETLRTAELPACSGEGAAVATAEPEILDAFFRLTELLEYPERIQVLAPLFIREIHYRLLIGNQGEWLKKFCAAESNGNQISRAIVWLQENYQKPLSVESLAKMINMAPSTFHRHFREVTSISPLQYQKRLRLYEARRLMLTTNENAALVGFMVGYESQTQFNREYRRLFGQPPHRDTASLWAGQPTEPRTDS